MINEKELREAVDKAKAFSFQGEAETAKDFKFIFDTFIDLAERYLACEGVPEYRKECPRCGGLLPIGYIRMVKT